ncbi:hypothetical protein BJ165DRAFT_1447381 [Panaeolus papilionaceus]|nr:hypothetical protein BJ165DRAFT_1447381 [Panaeolus papilionaceus]
MASDQQVALTRTRIPQSSSHISKAARQVVPAFLQKLYEMVNDPNNAELIRWSDAGDSFFVLDHERFAHEVLGRWFKHRNFASFVRQLNMYGFHKIPHLQQGVLKSDTDTEFWNFAHVNFHRGQPDLLCLIQRKKPMQGGDDNVVELQGSTSTNSTSGGSVVSGGNTLPSGQVLDIGSVLAGIQAIKRHQTTISAELNELKRSNELLWQDALTARAKHQKQQDTINRIVKFLAGVFGSQAGGGNGSVGNSPTPGSQSGGDDMAGSLGLPRRKARLMIEDSQRDGPRKSMVEELTEMPIDTDPASYEQNYPTVDTPVSTPSPTPSVAHSDNISIAETTSNDAQTTGASTPKGRTPTPTPSFKSTTASVSAPNSSTTTTTTPTNNDTQLFRPVTPSRQAPMLDFNNIGVQNFLNSLTPAQLQGILTQLAAQTFPDQAHSQTMDPHNMSNSNSVNVNNSSSTSNPQNISYDFTSSSHNSGASSTTGPTGAGSTATNQVGLQSASTYPNHTPSLPLNLIPSDGLISFDSGNYDVNSGPFSSGSGALVGNMNALGALTPLGGSANPFDTGAAEIGALIDPHQHEHEARVESGWKVADDIDKDVNALNASIDSLITTLGLDPNVLINASHQPGSRTSSGTGTTTADQGTGLPKDAPGSHANATTSTSGSSLSNSTNPPSDFDFDSFFNTLGSSSSLGGMGDMSGMDLGLDSNLAGSGGMRGNVDMTNDDMEDTAFLDEVPDSPATSKAPGSPVNSTGPRVNVGSGGSPSATMTGQVGGMGGMQQTLGMGTRSRKRKSEVVNDVGAEDAMAALQVGQPGPPGGGIKVNLNVNTNGAGGGAGGKAKKRKG